MKLGLSAFWLLTIVLFSSRTSAQSQQEDSIFYQSALARTTSVYYNQLGDQSPIYNGSLYPDLGYTFQKGTPFFLIEKTGKGSVVYDDILYPNLSIFYEDYRQYLVVIDQAFQLKLVNERISAFTIADHHFVHMYMDSLTKGLPSAGFYEVIYSGKSQVLKHTNKKLREILSVSEGLSRYMDEFDDYYIRSWNTYVLVKSKHEFLNFVGDHKKEVQRFIRKNKLNYRTDKDNTLKLAAAYYDQIANH
jgi:hypothetical protein